MTQNVLCCLAEASRGALLFGRGMIDKWEPCAGTSHMLSVIES